MLGMHRSGTSATAGLLAHLGASTPKTLLPPAADNPRGFWESSRIVSLNERILGKLGVSWRSWWPIRKEQIEDLRSEFAPSIRSCLEEEFGDAKQILVKDPRICRLFPLWESGLRDAGCEPLVVLPLRHPEEVACSLGRRDSIAKEEALLLWLAYVLDAEKHTRHLNRSFLLYDDLISDWRKVFSKLASDVGFSDGVLDAGAAARLDEFIAAELKNNRSGSNESGDGLAEVSAPLHLWGALRQIMGAERASHPAAMSQLVDPLINDLERATALIGPAVSERIASQEQKLSLFRSRIAEKDAALSTSEGKLKVATDREKRMDFQLKQLEALQSKYVELVEERARIADSLVQAIQVGSATESAHQPSSEDALENEKSRLPDLVVQRIRELTVRLAQADALATSAQQASNHLAAQLDEVRAALDARTAEFKGLQTYLAETETGLESANLEVCQLQSRLIEMEQRAAQARTDAQTSDSQKRIALQANEILRERLRVSAHEIASLCQIRLSEQARADVDRESGAQIVQVSDAKQAEAEARGGLPEVAGGSRDSADLALVRAHVRALSEEVAQIKSSLLWRITSPLRSWRWLGDAFQKRLNPAGRQASVLRKSALFDATWYLERYPDVRQSGVDPAVHYLKYGAWEGRDPSPDFCTREYLQQHPYLEAMKQNPLLHCIEGAERHDGASA